MLGFPTIFGERRSRVVALMNAISDLHEGDLLTVLELDRTIPIYEIGPNDMFRLEDGRIIHVPGFPPPPKSLKQRVQTGEQLARILEQHLMEVLVLGEVNLASYKKERRKNDRWARILGPRARDDGVSTKICPGNEAGKSHALLYRKVSNDQTLTPRHGYLAGNSSCQSFVVANQSHPRKPNRATPTCFGRSAFVDLQYPHD
jgi:hypothetical protein